MTAALIQSDIELIDFYLAYPFHRGAEVVLQAVGREPEEGVDQTVISDDRQ